MYIKNYVTLPPVRRHTEPGMILQIKRCITDKSMNIEERFGGGDGKQPVIQTQGAGFISASQILRNYSHADSCMSGSGCFYTTRIELNRGDPGSVGSRAKNTYCLGFWQKGVTFCVATSNWELVILGREDRIWR